MNTTSRFTRRVHGRGHLRSFALGAVAATVRLAALAFPLVAQEPDSLGLWAAQTGPNQVTLAWDSVPGAAEYRIYLGDPNDEATFTQRPVTALSAGARGAVLTGMGRLKNGITLVAVDRTGRVRHRRRFNAVVPATSLPSVTGPANLTAETLSDSVLTLSWDPVPGATAYFIGRAVDHSGFRTLCTLCSTESRFVDRDVTAGVPHTYTVAAIFPNGVSTRVTSNTVTPGQVAVAQSGPARPTGATPTGSGTTTTGTGTTTTPPPGTTAGATTTPTTAETGRPEAGADSVFTFVNPQIPASVRDTAPAPLGPDPNGDTTPTADLSACVIGPVMTPVSSPADTLERIDPRAERIEARTTTNPDAVVTANVPVDAPLYLGSAAYQQGKCINPGAPGYPTLWDAVAMTSGMSSAEQISAWKEIGVIALEYKHILGRVPRADETRRDVAALKGGTTWQQLWRQLAHSKERDSLYGYWAPAPIPDTAEAQKDFRRMYPAWTPLQCFGAIGPNCGGGIPNVINNNIAPYWYGAFLMPDGTQLAYVEVGVAVGSILHDNACIPARTGLNCNGLSPGDLVKTGSWTAALEWNKAAWNVIDQRTWRASFGPYPTNVGLREHLWYDDLRGAIPRFARMEPAMSMISLPVLTELYTGGETRRSRALTAPPGTALDDSDVEFCRSGAFSSKGTFPLKAPWGICR